MTRAEMIEALATYFKIEPNENGEYDLNSYDWQCGGNIQTFHNGEAEYTWMSLANVVEALEDYCDYDDDDDDYDDDEEY